MLQTDNILRSVAADDWFLSVDLKDAYFYIPIVVYHRKILQKFYLSVFLLLLVSSQGV